MKITINRKKWGNENQKGVVAENKVEGEPMIQSFVPVNKLGSWTNN
jgi:hypothetical protein